MTAGGIHLTAQSYHSLIANWRALPRVMVEPILCAFVLLIFTLAFEALLGIEETMPAETIRRAVGLATAFELTKSVVIWLAVAAVFAHWCRHLLGRRNTTWSELGLATWSMLPAWVLSGALLLLAALVASVFRQLLEPLEHTSDTAQLFPAEPGLLAAILMIWCFLSARLFAVMALHATMTPNAWRASGNAIRGHRIQFLVAIWLTVVPPIVVFEAADVTGGDLTEIIGAVLLALMAGSVAANFIRHPNLPQTGAG
jgi:hypothetical protein